MWWWGVRPQMDTMLHAACLGDFWFHVFIAFALRCRVVLRREKTQWVGNKTKKALLQKHWSLHI